MNQLHELKILNISIVDVVEKEDFDEADKLQIRIDEITAETEEFKNKYNEYFVENKIDNELNNETTESEANCNENENTNNINTETNENGGNEIFNKVEKTNDLNEDNINH